MTEPTHHQMDPEQPAEPVTIDRYLDRDAMRLHAHMLAGALELLRYVDDGDAAAQLLEHELMETYRAGLTDGLNIWTEHGGLGMPDTINVYTDAGDSEPEFTP